MSYGFSIFLTFEELSDWFPKWLHHFTIYQKCMRVSVSSHPCQYLLLSVSFYYNCPNGCEVVSDCGIDVFFSNVR